MKFFLFLLLLMVVQHTIFGQCDHSNELAAKDKYSKKISTDYSYKDGIEKIISITTSSYDKKGNEKSYIFQHTNDSLKKTRNNNIIDRNGHIVKQIRRDPAGNITDSLVYKYDENGNKVEDIFYQNGHFDSFSIYKYDGNCNQIAYIAYLNDSSLWFHYADLYDENNLLISATDVSHTGETIKYERNEKGDVISQSKYDREGNLLSRKIAENEYDKKGNLILVIWKDESGKEMGKEIQSFKKGILQEKTVYDLGQLKSVSIYDKKGNLISNITYTEGEPNWKSTYQYVYYK